jgi:hypothetical protein
MIGSQVRQVLGGGIAEPAVREQIGDDPGIDLGGGRRVCGYINVMQAPVT